jgi:hypothetical protein
MYNPVLVELVARDKAKRMAVELSVYQAINQAEQEIKAATADKSESAGVIRLVRRLFSFSTQSSG